MALAQNGTKPALAPLEGVLEEDERRLLRELAVSEVPAGTQSPADCVLELKHFALKRRLDQIQVQVERARLEGANEDKLNALLQEKLSVKRLMGSL